MRGLEFSGIRGYRFPSPQPSPHGRGGGCGEVCDWGWMKVLLPIPPNRAGESEDKCGPHPSPLPWGEVGPQVRVRGSGLTGVRRDRIPSPPSPRERGRIRRGLRVGMDEGASSYPTKPGWRKRRQARPTPITSPMGRGRSEAPGEGIGSLVDTEISGPARGSTTGRRGRIPSAAPITGTHGPLCAVTEDGLP